MSPDLYDLSREPAPDPALIASSDDALTEILRRSNRDHVPIRNDFIQRRPKQSGTPREPQPGLLSDFVHRRDTRGLLLYLLIRALASKDPWDVCEPAAFWARALDLNPASPSSRSAISKALRRLRELQLITTTRRGRQTEIIPLSEDGQGKHYTHPGAHDGYYFKLPHEFFSDGWHRKLELPAIAMLLVLLSRESGSTLPVRKVETWYGISASTAERGLQQLREHNLIISNWVQHPDPRDPRGYRFDMHHRLLAPFYKHPKPDLINQIATPPKKRKPRRSSRRSSTPRKEVPTS